MIIWVTYIVWCVGAISQMLPFLKITFSIQVNFLWIVCLDLIRKCNFEQSIRLYHFLLTIYWNQSFKSFVIQTSQPFQNAKAGNYLSFQFFPLSGGLAHCHIFLKCSFQKLIIFKFFSFAVKKRVRILELKVHYVQEMELILEGRRLYVGKCTGEFVFYLF